jgi:hypothetical protein
LSPKITSLHFDVLRRLVRHAARTQEQIGIDAEGFDRTIKPAAALLHVASAIVLIGRITRYYETCARVGVDRRVNC